MPRFWTKWLRDIADSQGDNGQVPHVCPIYLGLGWDAAWGGNYPQLVWYLYQYYDDERLLEEHYDGMKRVVDYMTSVSENLIIVRGIYGDHMLPGSEPGREEFISSETPRELVWTGYFYRAALAVSQAAGKLGRGADAGTYAALADDIRTAFNDKWLDAGKHVYATGSQTAQAFPLALDIVPAADRAGVIERLVRSIAGQYDNHHHTGNTGATCLIDVLRGLGHGELLWKVVTNRTYPGWGFMVAEGATTIWESWSLSAGCGNAESMIMWATIDEFFYNDLAGIRGPEYYGAATVQPGFKEIRIAPFVPRDLNSARGSIMTAYGMVSASWRKTADGIMLEVEVPPNATARVGVPKLGKTNVAITESGTRVWKDGAYTAGVDGIAGAVAEDEFVTFDVGSGSYRFDMKQVP
jgi:alpha-L-rhamnosidase